MNNEYKTIPFAEVKIGQEFEDAKYHNEIGIAPWIKESEESFKARNDKSWDLDEHDFTRGCLVRTADCEPIKRCWEGGTKATCDCPDCGPCLVDYTETPEERKVADFDTWWGNQCEFGNMPIWTTHEEAMKVKRVAKAAWDAAKAN